jgi:hypothetical protein
MHFREYQIERGDFLIRICLRHGHRNWRAVYNHPENAPFRARFPDPNQIDHVNSVNLLIALVGDTAPARPRRTRPIEDYFIVRVCDDEGLPLPGVSLRWIEPAGPPEGRDARTDANGELIFTNPALGMYEITALDQELVPAATSVAEYPAQDVSLLPLTAPGGLIDPATRFPLARNVVSEFVARPVFFITCPMCGTTFKTVRKAPTGSDVTCPNDGENLSRTHDEVQADPVSFQGALVSQNPQAIPNDLVCRGSTSLATRYGTATVFWDESRFARANGGGYTLWGRTPSGTVKTVRIVGRATWGARAPMFGGGRLYEFHQANLGAAPVYTFAIPTNDFTPLRDVLFWITVHHTTDVGLSSHDTARNLQRKHQDDGGEMGLAADIGYHFLIDANGDVYEGRPLGIEGSHVGSFNAGNVGIAIAGDFESRLANGFHPDNVTPAAQRSLEDLVDVLAARFTIRDVGPHMLRNTEVGRAATECPGDNLEPFVTRTLRARYPGPA